MTPDFWENREVPIDSCAMFKRVWDLGLEDLALRPSSSTY